VSNMLSDRLKVRLVYFASLREKIGKQEEEIAIDNSIETVIDLISFLKNRGENYQAAFDQLDLVRVALDKKLVAHEAILTGAKEVAFFPPMTGG